MKLLISFITTVNLGLACTVLGDDNYSALAAQGYRWVTVGPTPAILNKTPKELLLTIPMRRNSKWWRISSATISYRELSFR
jgi:hypothetical protein